MNKEIYKLLKKTLPWIVAIIFALFYPMLISIYVFIPLMIGFMGFVLIEGINKSKSSYILLSIFYFINLEVNLSLPLFLTLSTSILFYITIYPRLIVFKKCKFCIPLLSVIFIDLLYIILLLGYDFIFNESSIVIDKLLIYSFLVDTLMVFLL